MLTRRTVLRAADVPAVRPVFLEQMAFITPRRALGSPGRSQNQSTRASGSSPRCSPRRRGGSLLVISTLAGGEVLHHVTHRVLGNFPEQFFKSAPEGCRPCPCDKSPRAAKPELHGPRAASVQRESRLHFTATLTLKILGRSVWEMRNARWCGFPFTKRSQMCRAVTSFAVLGRPAGRRSPRIASGSSRITGTNGSGVRSGLSVNGLAIERALNPPRQ